MDSIKEESNKKSSILDKTIDFIFSKDKRKWLVLFLIIGIILRLIVANNVPPLADEMVHGSHAINIISSGVINEQNECPVWFYLTDLVYRFLGVNGISARFLSIFFGTLTILLVYLISKRLFNEKIALISSFLLAISAFHIRYALMEQDEAMMFFVLLAFYYFVKDLEEKNKITFPVFVFMAIAFLIKPIAVTFIPAIVIYFFYRLYAEKDKTKRKEIFNKNLKPIIIGSITFLLFMSPILVYNYLLYKEKGITDIQFSRFFNISQQTFEGLAGHDQSYSISYAIRDGPKFLWDSFTPLDPIITLLGIIGIFLILFSKKPRHLKFLISFHLITFIFLLGTSLLQTHFVIFLPLLCICSGYLIAKLSEYSKSHSKEIIITLLIIILLVDLWILWPFLSNKSGIFKVRDFAMNNIGKDDLVIADARIYRGSIVFMLHDKHYLESSYFSQLLESMKNMPGETFPVTLYFIECVQDDCGWGTIVNQPEFNQSVEQMADFFKNNSEKVKSIKSKGEDMNIYKTTIPVKSQVFQAIDSTHQWFYYPVMWKGERYDSYKLDTFFKQTLQNIAYVILWIAIIIALLSPLLIIYELVKKNQ